MGNYFFQSAQLSTISRKKVLKKQNKVKAEQQIKKETFWGDSDALTALKRELVHIHGVKVVLGHGHKVIYFARHPESVVLVQALNGRQDLPY